jgi:tight adherence protein C
MTEAAIPWLPVALASGATALLFGGFVLERWLGRRDRLRRRLEAAARVGARVGAGERTALLVIEELKKLFARLTLGVGGLQMLSQRDREKVAQLLTRAGWRSSAAVGNYGTLKSVASLVGLLVGLALVLGGGLADGQPALQLVAVMVGAFLGGMLPEFVVQQLARRRQKRVKEHLADAVDLMIIAANAGQSLDMSLGRVAEEMSRRAPALGEELTITISELRGMSDRRQPLENLAKRTDLREVKSVTATLVQTLRYGTPLTQSLKNLAREMREARMLALEEKAAKLPALLSLPLMLFIMPAIFVVTAGPAVLAIAEAFSR